MTATAKLFTLGKSQAVRIPARFRLQADEVEITQEGGALLLRPKPRTMGEVLARIHAKPGHSEAWKEWKRPPQDELEAVEPLEP
jgi:antitoxin VapB